MNQLNRWPVWMIFGIGLLLLPFLIKDFRVFQLSLMLIYAIALLGLNILTGYGGQISLGHGAFYAIGGYCAAMLMDRFGLPYMATIPIAAAVCFVAGILMGFPALRLGGHYLALATFALALAMPQLLKFKHFEHFTGGVQGIILMKPTPPIEFSLFGQPLSEDRWLYFMVLGVTVIMFIIARNLLDGRIGRAIVAVRDQPIAAGALGVNLAVTKTITFGVSAAFTGVAGALGAITVAFVAPDSFNVFLSISFLVGVVVGGLASW
ncbi:MAG: branched-chain amino acid ABC transporter permease [Betaproteobacteria bacterium]|nr:branched-chain amino acid ABC transporter permease [Betaproteobacteria bacterium]